MTTIADLERTRGTLLPRVRTFYETLLAVRPAERVLEAGALRATDALTAMALNVDSPAVAVEREVRIPGPAGETRALLLAPQPPSAGPLPILVYLHGGGFVVMGPETHAKLTKQLALAGNCVVVSVDYRRAPEHSYPAPLDDCVAAFRWAREHAADIGGDASRVAVGGDSAGGSLAAATALRLIDAGEPPPCGVVLICAWLDLAMRTESFRLFGPDDPVIDNTIMKFFRESYTPSLEHRGDAFASPLRADLAYFPPACVVVGGIDPLRDDDLMFAEKLQKRGRDVTLLTYEGMPHDFLLWQAFNEHTGSIEAIAKFLRSVLYENASAATH